MIDDTMQIGRRALLGSALLLLGASAATSFTPAALAKAAAGPKRNLDPQNYSLLGAVADTIMPRTDTPGAVDAGVPAKLDAMLETWASPESRAQLAGALTDIDSDAKAKKGRSFTQLTPAERKELLVAYDIAALKPVPRTGPAASLMDAMAEAAVVRPGYAKLKELILLLYYYSEEALTTELTYEHSPGGWTPSVKVTPATRATGGLGMF